MHVLHFQRLIYKPILLQNIVLLSKEYELIDFRFLTFFLQLVESVPENN